MLDICDLALIAVVPLFYLPVYYSFYNKYLVYKLRPDVSIFTYYMIMKIIGYDVLVDIIYIDPQSARFIIYTPVVIWALWMTIKSFKYNKIIGILGGAYLSLALYGNVFYACWLGECRYCFIFMLVLLASFSIFMRKSILNLLRPPPLKSDHA